MPSCNRCWPNAPNRVDLGKAPKAGAKSRVEFDVRQALANWAGVDLTRINGLGVTVVMKLLAEIGPDVGRIASVKHFCSWLGLCPGTKISGGKGFVHTGTHAAIEGAECRAVARQAHGGHLLTHSDCVPRAHA